MCMHSHHSHEQCLNLNLGLQKLRETAEAVTRIEADLKISLEEADHKRSVAEGIADVVSKEKVLNSIEK